MRSFSLDEVAAHVAYCYSDLDYFSHALEVLLHDVLDDDELGQAHGPSAGLLPRVVRFLQRFPNYLEVIVQCARKTEYALWEYLFGIVGDAKALFEQCLELQQLRTATSYLLILQTLEPASVSSKYAVELLERSFESEDYELCKELVRFLSSITTSAGEDHTHGSSAMWIQQISARMASLDTPHGSEPSPSQISGYSSSSSLLHPDQSGRHRVGFRNDRLIADSPVGGRSPDIRGRPKFSEETESQIVEDYGSRTLPDGTDLVRPRRELVGLSFANDSTVHQFYIEVLVSKHARNLLSSYRIRTLGRLASSLRFPLISWIRKEKWVFIIVTPNNLC
jgi:hypothetical protein